MRIILKPMGAIAVLCVILSLAILALKGAKTTAERSVAVVSTATPSAPPSPAATPQTVRPVQKNGHVVMTVPGKGTLIQDTLLPDSLVSLPENASQGAFIVHVLCQAQGKTSQFPKYGIEVRGADTSHSYQAWIDPSTGVLARDGNPGNMRLGWHNSPLPPGFDLAKEHILQIRWKNGGKTWQCLVDGDEAGKQEDVFTVPLKPQQFFLKTEDTNAVFRDMSVR